MVPSPNSDDDSTNVNAIFFNAEYLRSFEYKNPRAGQVIAAPKQNLEIATVMPFALVNPRKNLAKKNNSERLLYVRAFANSGAYEISSNTSRDPEVGKLV